MVDFPLLAMLVDLPEILGKRGVWNLRETDRGIFEKARGEEGNSPLEENPRIHKKKRGKFIWILGQN